MSIDRDVADARELLAAWRGVLDAATVAWLDQRAARLAEAVPMSLLVEAWGEDDDLLGDVDPDEVLLGRLVVATAIVTKAMPTRIAHDATD